MSAISLRSTKNNIARDKRNDRDDQYARHELDPPSLEKTENGLNGGTHRLAVHLAKNDVECADDGDNVGNQMPARHLVERLQIDE